METDNIPESKSLDGSIEQDFSGLYPRQKSYDEMLKRLRRLEEYRLSQLPKFTLITAGLTLAVVLAVLLNAAQLTEKLFSIGGAMAGAFIYFFVGLILFGVVVWQLKRLYSYFYKRGLYGSIFLVIYVTTAASMSLLLNTLTGGEGSLTLSIILSVSHWVVLSIGGLIYAQTSAS